MLSVAFGEYTETFNTVRVYNAVMGHNMLSYEAETWLEKYLSTKYEL